MIVSLKLKLKLNQKQKIKLRHFINSLILITVKFFTLFTFGGGIYTLLELIYRGKSNISMFILGGLCFTIIGAINNYIDWNMPLYKQMFIGSIIITSLEYVTGYIVNLKLGWNVWDYSNLPFNLNGQICLYFYILWYFISLLAIILDDYLRYKLFDEKLPKYKYF